MSSKEKVLAIRPEAVCVEVFNTPLLYEVREGVIKLGMFASTESEAWAAAYKYLTNEGKNN
jgi:hypothetical protein